jgi:hypothetical protein
MRNHSRRKKKIWRASLWVLTWAAVAVPAAAQDQAQPVKTRPYQTSGSLSIGNRFLDVSGNLGTYNELINLQPGFRVFSADLNLRPTEPGHGWFDNLSFTTQNLGGDPFPVVALDIRKNGVYDFRASYRATQYFYDLPQTDLTANRGWIDRRRFGDAELRYTPTRNLKFRFFYNKTERAGTESSSGPFLFFPIAPDVWQAFGRASGVPWVIPLREEANLFGGGLDYHWRKTDFHVEQSYRTYNNPASLEGFSSQPIQLIGPGSPSQNVVPTRWDTFAAFNIPMVNARVEQEINERLRFRAGYIYEHASGPTSLSGSLLIPVPALVSVPSPGFSINYTGEGTTRLTTQTADAGFTLKLLDSLNLISDYRYQIFSQTGQQSINATRTDLPALVPLGSDILRWDFGMHTLDTVFGWVPFPKLSVRAGLRFFKEDIVSKVNGQEVQGTQRSWYYTPVIDVAWRPSPKLRLQGKFERRTVVDPYIRISPENTVGSNIKVHFSPSEHWGIDNTFSVRNQESTRIQLDVRSRANSTSVWFQPADRLSLNAGFTYRSFFSNTTIRYLVGTMPLTGLFSTDQDIDRIYSCGLRTRLAPRLTLSFSGQFLRSTGLATFTGESTTYGPLTWPAWDTSLSYQLKEGGEFVFGWQHSYYLEDLVRTMDFRANALRIAWNFSF